MTPQTLRAALRAGRPVVGTLIVADSPRWPASVAQIGLDFVFIDTEHIAIDRASLSWMCQTYAALGLPPIVRIPSPDPYAATMALDAGAAGVVAPYVETVEQVQALRGAVKLRPIKGAKLQAALEGTTPLEPTLVDYQRTRAAENVLIINIESRPALENLDALLAVEGVDAALIGPHDLSCSLGVPENYDAPEFDAAVRAIARGARARGVGAGIHSWMGVAREASWAWDGMNLFIHSADIIAMRQTLGVEVRELRAALGGAAKADAAGAENI
ncbi:MAG: aldolase [Verrucomicrobia bacterium]|nr:aldolase [Verrucomicrobiota bacterium]